MERILGAARQSKTADRAVSLPAQREAIERYAADKTLVAITEDPSTSGGTSIFDRAGIGPWLERHHEWDVLVATKLDRLCRDVSDFMRLRDWLHERGKRLVLLNQPELDETSPSGRLMANLLAVFAEFEREMIRERAREKYAHVTAAGRWPGGRVPYGMKAERRDDGYYLVTDDDSALPDMIAKAVDGESNAAICRWLNENGLYTAIGKPWRPATVGLVLQRAADGNEALRDALASRRPALRGEWTSGRWMLLRIAYCNYCRSPLYAASNPRKPGGGYYHCLHCTGDHAVYAQIARLEADVEAMLLGEVGDLDYYETRVIRGDDHAREIRKLESQLATVKDVPLVDTSALEAEISRLRTLPHQPDRKVREPTGLTWREEWQRLSTAAERNAFLRANQVRVDVGHGGVVTWFGGIFLEV